MAYRRALVPSRRRRAGAAIELALLLPFLVFLFLMAVDFARVFYCWLTIENCARNGAAYGCLASASPAWQGSSSRIQSIQQAAAADGAGLSPPVTTSNVSVVNATDADGNTVVQVTVSYDFATVSHLWGIPSTIHMSRTAQMRIAP